MEAEVQGAGGVGIAYVSQLVQQQEQQRFQTLGNLLPAQLPYHDIEWQGHLAPLKLRPGNHPAQVALDGSFLLIQDSPLSWVGAAKVLELAVFLLRRE